MIRTNAAKSSKRLNTAFKVTQFVLSDHGFKLNLISKIPSKGDGQWNIGRKDNPADEFGSHLVACATSVSFDCLICVQVHLDDAVHTWRTYMQRDVIYSSSLITFL